MKEYDYAVIGGGSAGVRSARVAASLGKKVVLFEPRDLGGTCVNRGCIPKKLYVYASMFGSGLLDADSYGWHLPAEAKFDLSVLNTQKNKEISRLNSIYENLLKNSGAEIVRAKAVLTSPNILFAGGEQYYAKNILIAVGGHPFKPAVPGKEHAIVSDDVFRMQSRPDSVIVIGGGYIAVEMASVFRGWGTQVTLVYRGARLLKHLDHDIGNFLAAELRKKGITVMTETDITAIRRLPDNMLEADLSDGKTLKSSQILYATGRKPLTDNIGLDAAGVKLTPDGKIEVNDQMQTSVPHIYAAGDVCSAKELATVATRQGEIIARNLFEGKSAVFSSRDIPTAIFSLPPAATVGLSEEQALAKGPADIYISDFRPLKYTITENAERTMMKLVVCKQTQQVLGVHMVGTYAPEIMQGFAVAVKMKAKKENFDAVTGIHPTSAEEFVTMRTPKR